MSQQKKQALLEWLSKVLHTDIHDPSSLRNGQLLMQLCNKIPGINLNFNPKNQGWKDNYMRLKLVHQEISSFMRNVIKYEFPNAIETINLVEMAKGHDDQSLVSLLNSIFLVSFNLGPENSQLFVQKAMMVSAEHQQELCDIVQSNPVPKYDSHEVQQYEQKYQKQRQKVTSLITALQSLSSQNDSLRQSLILQSQQMKKLTQQLKKTEQQKEKIKRQLLQIYNKHQQQQQPQKHSFNEHHEQMIEILKSNILEQEQNYSQQIFELKEKIQGLEQQLDIYKNKLHDMQENSVKGIVDHSGCINIQVYKKQKNELTTKLTEASAKQWQHKLENIKLQNQMEQLKEKNRKLTEQNNNIQHNPTCSKDEANKLKLQFYTQIRDKLKKKLQANYPLDNSRNIKRTNPNKFQGMIIQEDN